MKITITYKDDVFTVYKNGEEKYTRKGIAADMEKTDLPLSVALHFLLIIEGGVDADNVKEAIECLVQSGIYELKA